MSSTTLVELSPFGDIAMELAVAVNKMSGEERDEFLTACHGAVKTADASEFVRLVVARAPEMFKHPTDANVESAFAVLGAVVKKVDAEALPAIVDEMCAVVTAEKSERAPLRLRILANLYNLLNSASAPRFSVFMALVAYAAETGQLGLLKPYFAEADSWVAAWRLSTADARALFLRISDALAASGDAKGSFDFLSKFLGTFEDADDAALAGASEQAAKAAVNLIRTAASATSQLGELSRMKAVQRLAADAKYAKLFALLEIFTRDRLDAYRAFAKANADFIAEVGLDAKECEETMRLLSICSLAVDDEAVTYDAIMETLEVSEDEVETWVVKAIRAGLIEARMDQLRRVVEVSRYTQRVFSDDHWRGLQSRLSAWKGNVASLLATVQSGKRVAGGAGAAV